MAARGRPTVPGEDRELIRTMSGENLLWGAPKIHGELLKLGRDRRNECEQIYGAPPKTAAVPDMEDVPHESRQQHDVRGLL